MGFASILITPLHLQLNVYGIPPLRKRRARMRYPASSYKNALGNQRTRMSPIVLRGFLDELFEKFSIKPMQHLL